YTHLDLTRNPAASPGVEQRLQQLQKFAAEKTVTDAIAREGARLLAEMPRLKSQRLLRKEYQRLADGDLPVEKFLASRDALLAGRKLPQLEAPAYAGKVMTGGMVVRDNYVREVKLGALIAWAVRGLYRQIAEPVPPELAERLSKARDRTDAEL